MDIKVKEEHDKDYEFLNGLDTDSQKSGQGKGCWKYDQ